MSSAAPLQVSDLASLRQLPTEQLVNIIVQQQQVIEQQQQAIEQLSQEVNRLKVSLSLNSQTSSKPPSTDLLKKPEKAKEQPSASDEAPKRKPGGQPGHLGKTRKGFGRVDRYEILQPQRRIHCGSEAFASEPVAVQRQQVARLVARPIEVVEYQRHSCQCAQCGQSVSAEWPEDIVPGQDLSVGLQALLVWPRLLWASVL